jgi:competence protein ComEC
MYPARRDAFFFLFLGLATGAWLSFSLIGLRTLIVLSAGLLFGYGAFHRKGKTLLFYILGCAIGFCALLIRFPPLEGKNDYEGIVIAVRSNYFVYWSRGARYYVYEKATEREMGDILLIHGYANPYDGVAYESRFDFGAYLKTLGISDSLFASSIESRLRMPLRLRSYEKSYLRAFDPEAKALIDALLFSRKDYSQGFIQEASSLGCLYFLSASGLLYATFLRLAEKVVSLKLDERKTRIATLCFGALFLPFNVLKIGLWRVFLSKAIYVYLSRGGGKPPRLYVISLSGIAIMAANRYAALDVGFLLGYGLAIAMSLSRGLLRRHPGRKGRLGGRALLYALLLPSLVSSGGLHLLSFAYALLLLPFSLTFSLVAFFGFLTLPPVSFLNGFSALFVRMVAFFEEIDVVVPLGPSSEAVIALYYLLLALALFLSDCGLTRMRSIVAMILSLLLVVNAAPLGNAFSQEVDFVNVGQGDCIVIRDGYTTAMIDTGGNVSFDMAQEVDIPFLRKRRIYEVDCLIASHGDFDHIGAAPSLRRHFKVRKYVDSASSFPLRVGRLSFTNYNVYDLTSENEKSLVLSLDFMGKKWMFTGDAPTSIEDLILLDHPDLDTDILKVGHHGSKTSSSYAWIKTLTPEVGIVSVGKNNPYGHPDEETLERFAKCGVPLRRTDEEGTIWYRRWLKGAITTNCLGMSALLSYNQNDDPSYLLPPTPDGPRRFAENP